jgi:serine/threonine protein kinase
MPFAIGQNVGPYRILEQLGQGGMATVYKAYHAALDRFVAIKVLHTAFREDANFLARFTREARVVAKLEHSNIVPIFDYAECDGQPYLVMKYIEGETLKARLQKSPLGAQEAIAIVEAVGSALGYAHSKGILHRDIKPSNILLTPDGQIYLADFGLARIGQSTEATLSSDMLMGTPHYISPEQAQGLKDLDAGTDIYSFGVVMYELAVGRVPFNADTPFSIIHDHIFTPLPLPRSINPKVPEAVERVLLKALAKERKDRFASVHDMVAAFVNATRTAISGISSNPSKNDGKPERDGLAGSGKPTHSDLRSENGAQQEARKPTKGKKLPWWGWLLFGIGGCLCLIIILGFFVSSANRKNEVGTETAHALTAVMTSTEIPTADLTLEATLQEATFNEDSIPADTKDAWAHFSTAMNLYKNGQTDAAEKEFNTALELVPATRTAVIMAAAQRLGKENEWVMAGWFCLKGLSAKPNDPALNRLSAEVFYTAAGDSTGGDVLLQFVNDHPDMPLANAAYARWMIEHTDSTTVAKQYLDTARRNSGNMSQLVKAVLGEFQLYNNDVPNGITTLESVVQDPNSPPWLKAEAQRLINAWS